MSFGTLYYFLVFSWLEYEKNETSFDTKMMSKCDDRQRVTMNDIITYNNVNDQYGQYDHYDRLIYNRVPKCGSTTLIALLRQLSKLNHFVHINSKIYDQRRIPCEQQVR